MKVSVSYSELTSVLGYVNTILSDKTVEDKMKNVIFLVSAEKVMVVGYSALTFSRTQLMNTEIDDPDGLIDREGWNFQVRASELNKILSCYNSLYKTKVENIEFSLDKNKVKVTIHEEAIDEEYAHLAQVSKFLLDNIPILSSVITEITMDFPEDSEGIISSDLLLYIDSLFPLMNNDTGITGKLNFGTDYVYVMANALNSFFQNKLPDAFKGITLGYSSVNFLKKLCENAETIDIQKTQRCVCIQSGVTEAFLKYQKSSLRIEQYTRRFVKENGIVLDRLYLRDVLKRMMISSKDGVVKMIEFGLEVSTDGFNQIIPLANKKGDVDNIKFKVSVPLFDKAIIGDDRQFPEEVYLYFLKSGNSYSVSIADSTGGWFSSFQARS